MKGKSIEERLEEYNKIREEAQKRYSTFQKVFCPALGQHVHFTSNGFNHLIYKSAKKERDKKTQILRFDMLEKAKFILENSTMFQEFEENMEYRRVNRHGKYVAVNLVVRSWGFIAMVEKFRVKVVATQIGNSKIEFFSVIPAWFIKQYRNIKMIENSTGGGLLNDNDEEVLKNATQGDDF
ncbi:MAG: hypothetical protein WC662_00335 [Candidatus Paceibacterota bacterium]|jgi:hypothetical protein